MKKVILLMLGLVAGTASFAQESVAPAPVVSGPIVHLIAKPDQKVQFIVQPDNSSGHISLRDEAGHFLYSANVSLREGLNQQFDIANLGIGTYRITLSAGSERVIKIFEVKPVPYSTIVTLKS